MKIQKRAGGKFIVFEITLQTPNQVSHSAVSNYIEKIDEMIDSCFFELGQKIREFEFANEEELKGIGK